MPVGRLDVDTTGALLLTNDGPLAHRLVHPRYEVDKVYEVETSKEPTRRGAAPARARASSSRTASPRPPACAASAPSRLELVAARGPQAPGEADVRGGRPPASAGCTAASTRGSPSTGSRPGEWRELTATRSRLEQTLGGEPRRTRSTLTKPMRSNIAFSVGSDASRAFSAPLREQPLQLARVGAQLPVALLDRRRAARRPPRRRRP